MRLPGQVGEIGQQLFRRQARHVDVYVFVQARHRHRLFIPAVPPAVAHDDLQIRKVHGDVVIKNGVAVLQPRAFEHGQPRVEHHRQTQLLRRLVQGVQHGVVGVKEIVGGVQLHAPKALCRQLPQLIGHVLFL